MLWVFGDPDLDGFALFVVGEENSLDGAFVVRDKTRCGGDDRLSRAIRFAQLEDFASIQHFGQTFHIFGLSIAP